MKNRDQPSDISSSLKNGAKPGLAIGEIDAKSVIPPDDEIRENYARNLKNAASNTTENPSTQNDSTTSRESENNVWA